VEWCLGAVCHAPGVGEGVDEEEAAARFVEGVGAGDLGRVRAGGCAGVAYLDAEGRQRARHGEPHLEVATGDLAVEHGVRGEFGDDQPGTFGKRAAVGDAPGVELVEGEEAREACASARGAEQLRECPVWQGDFTIHAPRACHRDLR
jgi:hypothetical protein